MPIWSRSPVVLPRLEFRGFPLASDGGWTFLVLEAFEQLKSELRKRVPDFFKDWDSSLAAFGICAFVAHAAKPYGPGSLPDLKSLLAAPALDCSNYGLLSEHILKVVAPSLHTQLEISFTGWQSEAIGNSQIVFARERNSEHRSLALSPTVGVIAHATFDGIASGKPVPSRAILSVDQWDILRASQKNEITAFQKGMLKPSELLYYFESSDRLLNFYSAPNLWPTPGAVAWRSLQEKAP